MMMIEDCADENEDDDDEEDEDEDDDVIRYHDSLISFDVNL